MPWFYPLLLSLLFAVAASAETIRVAAAISLKQAIGEIAKSYENATGDKAEFTFGASGQLTAQIKNGADVDLFISAANEQVEDLLKAKLVDAATRQIVVMNSLVLIVPADAKNPPTSFQALKNAAVARVAMGEPRTVPAGQYAEQVLQSLELDDALKPKIVYGTNVRQVLTYVERGEVSAGLVYLTDARQSGDKVRVVATADPKTHEPIVYPGVVVTASKKQDAAKKFLAFLATADAKAVFEAKGFTIPHDRPAAK
jgi:molybdate transport system substrate-binding protein